MSYRGKGIDRLDQKLGGYRLTGTAIQIIGALAFGHGKNSRAMSHVNDRKINRYYKFKANQSADKIRYAKHQKTRTIKGSKHLYNSISHPSQCILLLPVWIAQEARGRQACPSLSRPAAWSFNDAALLGSPAKDRSFHRSRNGLTHVFQPRPGQRRISI